MYRVLGITYNAAKLAAFFKSFIADVQLLLQYILACVQDTIVTIVFAFIYDSPALS